MWGKLIAATGAAIALPAAAYVASPYLNRDPMPDLPGYPRYIAVDQPLIAHGGGGLPTTTYANNLEAIDLAAKHGFELIELDFGMVDGELVIGHEGHLQSDLTVEQLLDWLRSHPGVQIVTDMKRDNVERLSLLKAAAGDDISRFIPQVYSLDEVDLVTALGYPEPILTIYQMAKPVDVDLVNNTPLRAVTAPRDAMPLTGAIKHPVYLHTVNYPMPGFGLYTDCLIPG